MKTEGLDDCTAKGLSERLLSCTLFFKSKFAPAFTSSTTALVRPYKAATVSAESPRCV